MDWIQEREPLTAVADDDPNEGLHLARTRPPAGAYPGRVTVAHVPSPPRFAVPLHRCPDGARPASRGRSPRTQLPAEAGRRFVHLLATVTRRGPCAKRKTSPSAGQRYRANPEAERGSECRAWRRHVTSALPRCEQRCTAAGNLLIRETSGRELRHSRLRGRQPAVRSCTTSDSNSVCAGSAQIAAPILSNDPSARSRTCSSAGRHWRQSRRSPRRCPRSSYAPPTPWQATLPPTGASASSPDEASRLGCRFRSTRTRSSSELSRPRSRYRRRPGARPRLTGPRAVRRRPYRLSSFRGRV